MAEKFSVENGKEELNVGLDLITQSKLKYLIENQMSKLLMRIEEENITSRSEMSMKMNF